MRIIAGEKKGKEIKCRKGQDTRPTLARVKESIFSIIAPYVSDSIVLDLYSGTGNLALEALSRGAKRGVMIEKDQEALKIIIENVNSMRYEDRCRAYKNDALRGIEILGRKREKFSLIFMDPPYKEELTLNTLKKIDKSKILDEGGIVVCEHHIKEKLPESVGNMKKIDERDYKNKSITIYIGNSN